MLLTKHGSAPSARALGWPRLASTRYRRRSLLCAVSLLAACGGGDSPREAAPMREAPKAIASPAASQWSALIPLSIVPTAAANLPNGKVVLWSAQARDTFGSAGATYTTVFDPVSRIATEVFVANTGHNMFCPGTSNLPDGRLLINGGIDSAKTSLYDPVSGNWSVGAQMNIARGYQSNCVLEDGSVFTLGGSWSGGVGNKHGEAWTEATGWRRLAGVPVDPMLSVDPTPGNGAYGGDSHFWLVTAGNGKVFHAGPGVNMHWIGTQGSGSVTPVGRRGDDEFSVNGSLVMYDAGKLLKTGGAPGYSDINANANSYLIDIGAGVQVRKIAPMAYRRAYHNSVVLPNGQVLIVGGQTYARTFNDDNSVLRPELFDPVTETFTQLPPIAVGRNYHSVALLLPDARVLSGGGGLCGSGCGANHPDVQILTPHYLLNADGSPAQRPVITSAPATATHGTRIAVTADSPISAFSLVRLSSNTHTVNNDQRRIALGFTQTAANGYELDLPSNPGTVVPGYYMLFASNADGVPSVARTVQITGAGAPKVTNPGDQSGTLNAPVSLAVGATGATRFSASGLPNGLTIDPSSGVIGGTPSQAGVYRPTISAGNDTATTSTTLQWTIALPGAGGVQYVRLEALSEINGNPWTSMAEFNLLDAGGAVMPRTGWSVSADSVETTGATPGATGAAANAIDGDPATMWHTQRVDANPPPPHTFTANLGSPRTLTGFKYLPRTDGSLNGIIAAWRLHTSANGIDWTLVAQGNFADAGNHQSEKTIVFGSEPPPNRSPTLVAVADRSSAAGQPATLALSASDPDGDALSYSASGLPPGLSLSAASGVISGTPTNAGVYAVSVQVADGRGGSASGAFNWTITAPDFAIDPVPAAPVSSGSTATFNVGSNGGVGVQYRWNFGDGSPETAPSTSSTVSHAYAAPGLYNVTVTATDAVGTVRTLRFTQAVYRSPSGTSRPTNSSNVAIEPRGQSNPRVWVVNQDNDTVSVFDAVTLAKVGEIGVGAAPRTLAVAPDGRVWVVNQGASSISVIDASTLGVVQTVPLARAALPYGIAFAPDGSAAYVGLEATGQVLKLNPSSAAALGTVNVGPNPRHLSISAASDRVLVSRFITPPLPGEGTASVATSVAGAPRGGEVVVLSAAMVVERTVVLQHSDKPDTTLQGSGVPNYLAAAVMSPDGRSAWVPSKQDNVQRGTLRNGLNLDFQNTVRAVSSRIDLATWAEDHPARVDHDNAGVAAAAAFHPTGAYLFVALPTSRQIAVLDPVGKAEVFRFSAGRAPDGLVVSADGQRLYVNNFMDRTLGVFDLARLVNYGEFRVVPIGAPAAVGIEKLTAQVLQGKRLFYDAQDPRLARDGYMSCASCHNDGRHDGRVWDLTGLGEGLRNTISLRGRAGAQGFLHWSNNFDEVHDFEGQIRQLAAGTGLMADADFNANGRNQPLGGRKAGVSADLDALAAYVASLNAFDASPHRPNASTLSAAAGEGKALFASMNCASCHAGAAFTNSGSNTLSNVGTLKPSSGQRSGAPLTGIDVPTLRDVWATAPYLHDGSAPTLEAAVRAHNGVSIGDADLAKLVAYLREIGSDEGAAPLPAGVRTIWPDSAVPTLASDPDNRPVNVGVKFSADQNGFITGIRFYKGVGNTGTHVGTLWTSTGTQLASVTFGNETATGWQQASFASPVAISAGSVYVASYFAPNGGYAFDNRYFANGGYDNAPLHALSNAASGGNGVFVYAAGPAFPSVAWQGDNYWVDVVFSGGGGAPSDTTPPSVSATSPTGGATGVSRTANVTATFSEALDPATVGASTFALRDGSGAAVAGTVSYNAATRVATFAPGSALAPSTTYTATVKGGATDPRVKDPAGNALAADRVWSFTTVAADVTPPTVTSIAPAGGTTDISRTTNVTATFSEALDASTIGTGTFELRDPGGALVAAAVGYNGSTRVATLDPTPTLAYGTRYTATVKGGAAGVRDPAGNALASDVIWSFTTVPEATPPPPSSVRTIWPDSAVPTLASDPDNRPVNVGVKFSADQNGFITGIRFYKGSGNTGAHVGTLWTSTGTQLASVTFGNETATGWQQASFASPVAISAGSVYVASYFAPNGGYAFDNRYFANGGYDNAPLHALSNAASGGNGVFVYAAGPAFPSVAWQGDNYWVDVVFSGGGGAPSDTTPPSVSATSPTGGTTGVSRTANVTATFSEALDASTVGTGTFELRGPGGVLVASVVSYNSSTRVATLNPAPTLAAVTVYTVTVKGGAGGVKDAAGNALAADRTWSFTTR